jgi:hypothetical protein
MGAGGVAGMAAGIATLTGIGAALLPILGPLAIALPLIGMLLPGQKPSSKMQGVATRFGGERNNMGFDGAKFDAGNRGMVDQFADSMIAQEQALSQMLGFRASGGFDVRAENSRKEGQPGTIQFRIGSGLTGGGIGDLFSGGDPNDSINFGPMREFAKDEAGLRALAEYASAQLFEAFKRAAEGRTDDMARIVRGSASMEALQENVVWLETTYKTLSGTMHRASEFGNALIELQRPFTDAIDRAKEFGLSIDGLAANLNQTVADFMARTLRDAQGRGFVDAVDGIVTTRGTADSALGGRNTGQLFDLAGMQLRALFQQLSPTQLLDALASTTDLQAQLVAQQVLAEMRAGALTQQQDITDAAGGRNSLVAARALLREFEGYASQMGALGLGDQAWARFAMQIEAMVSEMPVEQLEFLTAFDNMIDRLEDDLIRGIAATALEQRRAADAQARAAQDIERILSAGGGIRGFIDARRGTSSPGGPSPMDALSEAQGQFGRDLALAREGDMDALGRITGTADRLLGAGSAAFASGPEFQALREMTLSSLESLPVTRSYDAMILDALTALGGSVDVAVQVEMIRAITSNN